MIINPSASGVTARSRVVIQNAFAADHDLSVAETNRRGHATKLAQGAAASGHDVVVSVGGDGTMNEVANGLVHSDTALAVIPGGSTNVFARTIGLTNEAEAAASQLLKAIEDNSITSIGLGNVNGRYFCFHVGMGFDASVVAQVERRGQLKRWLGHPLFAFAAIDTWARHFDRVNPAFSAQIDKETSVQGFFGVALNVDPYTYLGSLPFQLSPMCALDNPLSLVILESLKAKTALPAVIGALSKKNLRNKPGVSVTDNLKTFSVTSLVPFDYQVDGDHLGQTQDLCFTWEPNALKLVMP